MDAAVLDLDRDLAERFAKQALANVRREFPNKLDHVLAGPADAATPRELHPAFYGSYDWHSSVHMHWLLATLRGRSPALPQRAAIDALFERHFAPSAIADERAYLARPDARSFERTYGWAWLLKLAETLGRADDDAARRWGAGLAPLAEDFVTRYLVWLPKAYYPIRHGTHPNSAFGVAFALDYARFAGRLDLAQLCATTARRWFAADRDAPWRYEPSGADFLSPTLIEAELMRRVLDPAEFAAWLERLLPGLEAARPSGLLQPVTLTDRGDPQIVHLDGLNLSRAWCWRGIAAALPAADPRVAIAQAAAERHLAAGLDGVARADYIGSHWLASFALLALGGTL